PFEAAYGLKPQHILDLVPLPQEARVSDDGEAFVDHIRRVHEEEFEEADMVLVHLRNERYPKETYHEGKVVWTMQSVKKIGSNAYLIEL
ncbi:LOW QUALITY PROTEIN: hypothetical protein CFOL_v3_26192, partial [Cephalotus follicularis]